MIYIIAIISFSNIVQLIRIGFKFVVISYRNASKNQLSQNCYSQPKMGHIEVVIARNTILGINTRNYRYVFFACATCSAGRKRSGPLFSLTFFFFSFFFFYAFCFWPTLGKLPWLKICFPAYFSRNVWFLCFF